MIKSRPSTVPELLKVTADQAKSYYAVIGNIFSICRLADGQPIPEYSDGSRPDCALDAGVVQDHFVKAYKHLIGDARVTVAKNDIDPFIFKLWPGEKPDDDPLFQKTIDEVRTNMDMLDSLTEFPSDPRCLITSRHLVYFATSSEDVSGGCPGDDGRREPSNTVLLANLK